jgi:uncharacterized protein
MADLGTLFGPLRLLILQPTPFCNIDCSYCYLTTRNIRGSMPLPLYETILAQVFQSDFVRGDFSLLWHAGEPLVLPISYYEQATEILARLKPVHLEVTQSFQVNGTLINPRWCSFFRSAGAKVGVSIDGPRRIHDCYRKTRRGGSTFDQVMNGIRCLQDSGVEFSVICVLTNQSLDCPDEMFEFFVSNGITNVGFNIEELEGANKSCSIPRSSTYIRMSAFLRRMLELNREQKIYLREFDIFDGRTSLEISEQCKPFTMLTFDYQGNVSTFSPELHGLNVAPHGEFVFGNIADMPLASLPESPKFNAVYLDILQGVNNCELECEYFSVCGGGAPGNKFFENGSFASTKTAYCEAIVKAVYDVQLECREQQASTPNTPSQTPAAPLCVGSVVGSPSCTLSSDPAPRANIL